MVENEELYLEAFFYISNTNHCHEIIKKNRGGFGLEFFNNGSCEEGEHDFMVTCDSEPFATTLRRTTNYIRVWPIVLNKVHVDGSEVLQGKAEVPCECYGFEKDFGKKNCGAKVYIHSPFKFRDEGTECEKIPVCCCTRCLAIEGGMHMDDVGADCHMNGDRDAEAVAGREEAFILVWKFTGLNHPADS